MMLSPKPSARLSTPASPTVCNLAEPQAFAEWTDQDRRQLRGSLLFLVILGTVFSALTTVLGAMACTDTGCMILFPLAGFTVLLLGMSIHALSGEDELRQDSMRSQEAR